MRVVLAREEEDVSRKKTHRNVAKMKKRARVGEESGTCVETNQDWRLGTSPLLGRSGQH
jgi:hypothetical protein